MCSESVLDGEQKKINSQRQNLTTKDFLCLFKRFRITFTGKKLSFSLSKIDNIYEAERIVANAGRRKNRFYGEIKSEKKFGFDPSEMSRGYKSTRGHHLGRIVGFRGVK